MATQKEQWGTRVGVILAVAGSAVGLGNFLRFPGQAAENGGGAFMIPYFISLVVVGIPICWAEWSLGRFGGIRGTNSCPGIFAAATKKRGFSYFGAFGVLIPVIIYMYYVMIESWCLRYAWDYLVGNVDLGNPEDYAAQSGEMFEKLTASKEHGAALGDSLPVFGFFLATFALNFYLIYRGVSRGIERFCIYAMPIMSLLAIVVLFRVLTLGTPDPNLPEQSLTNGLGFMWNPDFAALKKPETWLAAAGQIFFSLSVGFGVIINYASYLKKDDDVALSGLTSASTNEFFEVCLGGLITIPAAFVFLGVAYVQANGGFALGFIALPVVFESMPLTRLFGFAWFFMLFLAAVTSSLSMLQPAIAFLEEALGIGRKASVALLGIVTLLGSLFVIYFNGDTVALDTMDFWVGTFMLFVLATIEVLIFSWVLGASRGYEELNRGAEMTIPRMAFIIMIKYVTPAYLLIIFAAWTWNEIISPLVDEDAESGGPVADLIGGGVPLFSVIVIATVLAGLVVLIAVAKDKWIAAANAPDPE